MLLPEEVGEWVGNELRFCHNPETCAKDYRDASYYVRDLIDRDECPNGGDKLFSCARAEKEQLPSDTEFVKSAYTNSVGTKLFTSIGIMQLVNEGKINLDDPLEIHLPFFD